MARKKRSAPILVPSGFFDEPGRFLYPHFDFSITHKDPASKARIGQLKTPHGTIETPNFIFCGTKGAIKNLSPYQMREAKTDIILANTYHLMIQPGADTVEALGGLHKMTGFDGPMMTDSGGFQIFSMGHGSVADEIKARNQNKTRDPSLLKITEEGAVFRSYKDGSKLTLTPESSMEIQKKLGADLIYQLDECTAYHVDKEYTESSMHMSHRWGDRSLVAFHKGDTGAQALYGIVQGGTYEDLRKVSGEYTASRPFFGTAIGGSLGGSKAEFYDVVEMTSQFIHPDRPVHLLGIGAIEDIFTCVRFGIDTFDCVSPTRVARHGMALIKGVPGNRVNLRNARYERDTTPLDASSDLPASNQYSKGYLHHLFKAGEMLAMQVVAQHNVSVMNCLMCEIRAAIKSGTLDALEKEWLGF